jgi:hypothetical protein
VIGDPCAVDWPAFDLEPEDCPGGPAAFEVTLTCPEGHAARSESCAECADLMDSFGPDWDCGTCLTVATVKITPLVARSQHDQP